MASNRFDEINDQDLQQLREDLKNPNTVKSDKKAEKIFVEYLKVRWSELAQCDYWLHDEQTLDKVLCKFWFEVRQTKKDEVTKEFKKYTVISLKHLRYAINRNLKRHGHEYDITRSESFTKSQVAFEDACRLLKKLGLGHVKHYDEIKPRGMYFQHFIGEICLLLFSSEK